MNNRRTIFVDFEFNTISKRYIEQRSITDHEIVEFGAVATDESGAVIDSFHRYVKPMYADKISKFLIKHSGINVELLADKASFADVLAEFVAWCEADGMDYVIYAWSNSDLEQMTKEIKLKNINETSSIRYMLDNWFDLQFEYDTVLGFSKQQSLENALYMAGIEFEGEAHHALDDAANTAKLHWFLNDPTEKDTTIRRIKAAFNPEEDKVTLGDMLDWAAILAKCSFTD